MTDGAYRARVQVVMDHIREHLRDELNLDELAAIAHFSPFHFHRVFSATAGETPGAYRRRCRLERAVYLMKASPAKTLGSVAFDSGFRSQSDFSRVFSAAYGLAPSQWDRVTSLVAGNVDAVDDRGPGRFGRPDPPISTVIRRHRSVRIAYLRMRDPFRDDVLEVGYRRLIQWLEARRVAWRSAALFGISWDNYDATPLARVHFDLGFEVPDVIEPEHPITIRTLPAVTSIDAHSCGPLMRVGQAWDHLYLEWLPTSGYEPADLPAVKRFRRRPDETGWNLWDVDCTIALRRLRR